MKTFHYLIDLSRVPDSNVSQEERKNVEKTGQKVLFENYMIAGISSRYQQGLGGKMQRSYLKLLEKLDASKNGILELEDAEFDILVEIFTSESSRFLAVQTRIAGLYAERVEEALAAAKTKE